MSVPIQEQLYNLLPAVYRTRDAAQNETLRALLGVIESELQVVESDIEHLYENLFVETADDWLLPYIGDLLGVRWLHDTFSQRAYVANTLAYRRRKGTAAVLEQLARDVTGWSAHAVEFFQLLATTQHLNHVRLANVRTPDIRDTNQLELLDGPFERAAHTADVRRMAQSHGKYNIPNIGLFLWRLQSYLIEDGTARPVVDPPDGRYTFNPLGYDIPLFNRPETETEISYLAEEVNVPGLLRRRALYDVLEALRQALVDGVEPRRIYFGDQPVLQVRLEGQADPVPYEEILICDLNDWRDPPTSRDYSRSDGSTVPQKIHVAVDPVLGRIAFPSADIPGASVEVRVSYSYGFSADLGGGLYDRRRQFQPDSSLSKQADTVADPTVFDQLILVPSEHPTIAQALAAWNPAANPRAVIQIEDNHTYREHLAINMAGSELVIQAKNEKRPVLIGNVTVSGGTEEQRLTIDGLLIAGTLRVKDDLGKLDIGHCTLAPGLALDASDQLTESDEPKVTVVKTNKKLRLMIEHSIVGPLRLPDEIVSLVVRDSIVDSGLSRHTPALVSGSLSSFPTLTSASPAVNITIGDEGPYTARLSAIPGSLANARDLLQQAIRDAHDSPAFTNARVIGQRNRLVILPGIPGSVTVETAGGDRTATELRLNRAGLGTKARLVIALVSGKLPSPLTLSSDAPTLRVRIGKTVSHAMPLHKPDHPTFARVRNHLYSAIRGADSDNAFDQAMVASVDDQLVVLPGTEGVVATIDTVPADQTTLAELALESHRPAIASGDKNEAPGPPTTLERTTIFGRVHVKELTLASETIFTAAVVAQRLQTGCARFSYVPEGSRTPRRYRCQPELALQVVDDLTEQEHIRARLTPSFTSVRYSHPAYAQLSLTCAKEIRTGAEDGSEIGAFSHLRQPQREANLRASLDEYLRFGLEAGIFYVT